MFEEKPIVKGWNKKLATWLTPPVAEEPKNEQLKRNSIIRQGRRRVQRKEPSVVLRN